MFTSASQSSGFTPSTFSTRMLRVTTTLLTRCALLAALTAPADAFSGSLPQAAVEQNYNAANVGSGDGRIHIIPMVSPYSLKDGEKLYATAVVKSQRPIRSVRANLGGKTEIDLQINNSLGGTTPDNRLAIYSAEWVAAGLETKIYQAKFTVTDIDGHQWTDDSVSFSDPAAGLSTPGTTTYPNNATQYVGYTGFDSDSNPSLTVHAFDSLNECLYYYSFTSRRIIKVFGGNGTAAPTIVNSISLNSTEGNVVAMGIDPSIGYLYAQTGSSPSRIIKIALNGQLNASRVANLDLDSGDNASATACPVLIDSAAGHGYFQVNGSQIVKVKLGTGSAPPTRIARAATGLESVQMGVIDTVNKYAYYSTNFYTIKKMALGTGDAANSFVSGSTSFSGGESGGNVGIIDPAAGFMWWATNDSPSKVVQFSLGSGANLPTRVGAVTLNTGENYLNAGGIDTAGKYAWFSGSATGFAGQVCVKLNIASASTPARLGSLQLSASTANAGIGMFNPSSGYGYVSSRSTNSSSTLYKVALGSGTNVPTLVNSIPLAIKDRTTRWGAIDTSTGYAYFATEDTPARFVKTKYTSGYPEFVSSISTGQDNWYQTIDCGALVLDTTNGYAYMGASITGSNANVVKIALGSGDAQPSVVGTLALNSGETIISSAVIDSATGYAYFGINAAPGRVVKVALGSGSSAPTRTAALTLNTGESSLFTAIIDTVNKKAYFGTNTSPGIVVKVSLGAGAAAPTRDGAVTLSTGENFLHSSVIDTTNQYGYFATSTAPGRIIKVALSGSSTAAPTRTAALTLNTGEDMSVARGAAIDVSNGIAWFNVDGASSVGTAVRIALGSGTAAPTRVASFAAPSSSLFSYYTAFYDSTRRALLFGPSASGLLTYQLDQRYAVRATKLTMPQNGVLTDVRLYSHAAGGNVRLAIYDNSTNKNILWESPATSNTVTNGEIIIPISAGITTTALSLLTGTYWLAWQTDSSNNVGSYTLGSTGDGIVMAPAPFGAFPRVIPPNSDLNQFVATDTSRWTQYVNYDSADTTPPISSATSIAATNSTAFTIFFTASDPGGFGVSSTQLYVRTPVSGSFVATGSAVSGASGSFSYTATAGDGVYQFYTRATDVSSNLEAAPASADTTITLDRVLPSSSASITPSFINGGNITVNFTSSDALSGVATTRLFVRVPASGSYIDTGLALSGTSGSFSFPIASGTGTYQFYTIAQDNAGNLEAAPGSADDSIIVETTPPDSQASLSSAFAVSTASVTFTASDSQSGVASTSLFVKTPGNTTFANSGLTLAGTSGTFSYPLSSGSGNYEFYTISTDNAGNIESPPTTGDALVIQDLLPPVSVATVIPTSTSTSPVTVSFTSQDTAGVASTDLYVKTPGSSVFTYTGLSATGSSGSFLYYFQAGGGTYEFYTIATDFGGNVESAPGVADDSIVLTDSTLPSVVGGITRIDTPTTTSRDYVRFRITFSKPVAPSFSISDVISIGTLASSTTPVLVLAADPVYEVAVLVADRNTTGTIGISVTGAVGDLVGNQAALPINSPLYNFLYRLGDKNYDTQVDVDELNEVLLNYRGINP